MGRGKNHPKNDKWKLILNTNACIHASKDNIELEGDEKEEEKDWAVIQSVSQSVGATG